MLAFPLGLVPTPSITAALVTAGAVLTEGIAALLNTPPVTGSLILFYIGPKLTGCEVPAVPGPMPVREGRGEADGRADAVVRGPVVPSGIRSDSDLDEAALGAIPGALEGIAALGLRECVVRTISRISVPPRSSASSAASTLALVSDGFVCASAARYALSVEALPAKDGVDSLEAEFAMAH
jgi:hypothetical protein